MRPKPPGILIVNDDLRLCDARKLLESCEAMVYTACCQPSHVDEKLTSDLALAMVSTLWAIVVVEIQESPAYGPNRFAFLHDGPSLRVVIPES